MEDDGEWHTVTNSKTVPPPATQKKSSSKSNPSRRKSKHRVQVKKPQQQPAVKKSVESGGNPYHMTVDDDDSDEEEDDGLPDPIDLPVPPYHTSIIISCPFQDCERPAPLIDTTSLVQHLKQEHKLMFKNLHHMYMALDSYLQRWAKEFDSAPASDFGKPDPEDNQVYVIDPETCALDKEIREVMQREKLNEVLLLQQNEREKDSKLPRKCLFCKIVSDNRALLFKHMFAEHNFNIGLPDNLVFVNEFLDTLEAKLSKLQCLYCEKTFTSPAVLRKHMRKKKHFKIASKNRQYDRFYVINYLEPGKNWENFEHDNYDSDDDKRDESWADWEEVEQEPTMCLFDEKVFPSPNEVIQHLKIDHDFDVATIKKEKDLDFYGVIRLINYIRFQTSLNTCYQCGDTVDDLSSLSKHLQDHGCNKREIPHDAPFWTDPKYLLPTYDNDPLLTGLDDDEDQEIDNDVSLTDAEANKMYLDKVMERSLSISDNAIKRE
ncbi:hypothetical protein K501DRAFT_230806 [Backusella circina FSU 941]|nr:hypothetical protein K501DRAFT_230806 [Backusella circina FSU 941]